jgi:hypothetical protein
MTAMLVAGCSGAMQDVVHVVQVEGRIVSYAEPCLVNAYRVEQETCLDVHKDSADDAKACVAEVRKRWKVIVDTLAEEHDIRCKLEPAKCPAEGK